MNTYYFALDLIDQPELIQSYENWHRTENLPGAVRKSITDAGITNLEIYRTGNRLFMIMETDDSFSPERKARMDAENPSVQEWEQLMWGFQQKLPWAEEGQKWIPLNKIFALNS